MNAFSHQQYQHSSDTRLSTTMPPKASSKLAKNAPPNSNARNANSKNAPASAGRNARGRKPLSEEVIQCKRDARLHAGRECMKKGDGCEILQACGQFGVGQEFWPIDRFLEGEDFERLKANVPKKDWFKGKDCINKTMWQTYSDIMSQCNGPTTNAPAPRKATRKAPSRTTTTRTTKTAR